MQHGAPVRRRDVLSALSLALTTGLASAQARCRRGVDPAALRLGHFPNVTHGPALAGIASGRFARALGPVRLETRVFSAGPAAVEALLAGAVDVIYVGPAPVLAVHQRTRGAWLQVLCGAASGGASFVTRRAARVRRASDLHGARLGTPQLGNTQDVALRTYLRAHGLAPDDRGGDVRVLPMANADLFAQLRVGQLDGAWVPEPWAARMVLEADAELFVDERSLWPEGRFPTTLVAAREEYLLGAAPNVEALVRAHAAEVRWLREAGAEGRLLVNAAIARAGGRALPARVLEQAWSRVEFVTDPLEGALEINARNAQSLGFLPSARVAGLVAARWRDLAARSG